MNSGSTFHLYRTRYTYDFQLCRHRDGWVQFDTDQDASYFGIWVHPGCREIVTFAEGDETREFCESDTEYRAKLASMVEFYGVQPPAFKAIDLDGNVTEHYVPRPT